MKPCKLAEKMENAHETMLKKQFKLFAFKMILCCSSICVSMRACFGEMYVLC